MTYGMSEDALVTQMRNAASLGETRAAAMVTGAQFVGASPEADDAGYPDAPRGTLAKLLRVVFTEAFLSSLDRPIRTDRDNIIL